MSDAAAHAPAGHSVAPRARSAGALDARSEMGGTADSGEDPGVGGILVTWNLRFVTSQQQLGPAGDDAAPSVAAGAAEAAARRFVDEQRRGAHLTRLRGMPVVAVPLLIAAFVKELFSFAAILLAMSGALALFPAHGDTFADITALALTAAFDPFNDAGAGFDSGRVLQAKYELFAYGVLPLVLVVIILPRFRALLAALVIHAARAFALLDPLIGALVLAVCGIAGIQEYMRARGAMAQFLVALALDDERRARRERAVADAARRVTEEEAARFEQSFGYICHELRNPLHGICAGVKALQDGTLTPAEAAEELAAIAEGTALMVSITSDMTDLSKLRAGHFRVQLAPTPLRAVLDACVRAALPAADRPSDIQLDYDCAGGVPESITTDAARVRQIVTNGLTNALKYAPPGVWGPVRVVVRRAAAHGTAAAAGPSHISIEVLDAGPGLRGQSEEVLFADFASHVPATRTGAVGSSGLGLAICNRMARLLGGELHLHDRADGVSGTRFVLTLPVPDAAAAGAAALQNSPGSALVAGPARLSHGVVGVPAAPGSGVEGAGGGVPSPRQLGAIRVVVVDDGGAAAHVPDGVAPPAAAAGGLVSAGAAAAVATASEAPAAAGAAAGGGAAPAGATAMGLHVLLVDDSVGNRRVGCRMLQQLGCKCVLATDGDEVTGAVAAATLSPDGPFDVILLDLDMARVGGYEACRELRRGGSAIPIVAVSGTTDSLEVMLRAGFTGLLGKPFTMEQLRRALIAVRPS